MKNPFDILRTIPQELKEIIGFMIFVLAGSIFKMIKQKEKGVKVTVIRCVVEVFMSFFIAVVVYAMLNQFFKLELLFTLAACSLAGSVSSTLFHSKIEELLSTLFDLLKDKSNQYLNIKKNG
jgi:hypothetical protein